MAHLGQVKLRVMLNKRRVACVLICLGSIGLVRAASPQAQIDGSVDGVTFKGEQAYSMRGAQLEALTDVIKLPFKVEVDTNGVFTVAGGKQRQLKEGQVLRSDGWLLNPDGSVQPVFNHVGMKAGRVVVVRDDEVETVTGPMTFPNNMAIGPDGWCAYPSGNRARLADGQLFRLEGGGVPAQDTATLKNGQVVLQKDGTLLTRLPIQITGMCDGTRVYGNGTITRPDGSVTHLQEGQTVLIEGRAARR